MTKKKVWRYWCSFCKKAGLSSYWIQKHERACTANPDRVCGICNHAKLAQHPIAQLLAYIDPKKENCGLADLRKLTEDCPACILAAIRQSGICKWDGDPESQPPTIEYDFKAEMAAFWARQNEDAAIRADHY